MRLRSLVAALAALALVAAACGSDEGADDTTAATTAATTQATEATTQATEATTTTTEATTTAATEPPDACDPLPLFEEGVLTVATGETVFPPWMGAGDDDFDDPTTGTGFEGALVFALAEELGIARENVVFVRTGFDEVIAPGVKDWDFNIQQYTIRADRDEVVDFSDGYYQVEQAVIGKADGPLVGIASVADLKASALGAAIGTTSLDYIETVIQPDTEASVYDDTAAASAAFDAGQVDAIIADVPTAYFITAVQIEEGTILGVLPRAGEPDELGMLFEDGNPLVACVNEALAALRDAGTIEELEETWLSGGGDIPTLTP